MTHQTPFRHRSRSILFYCVVAFFCLATPLVAEAKKTVYILATGGTIAGAAESAVAHGYTAAVLPVEDLLAAVPQTRDLATLRGEQISQIASQAITLDIWLKLAKRVNELLRSGKADAVVITHGTDTMEETAYFLNLVIKSDKPVVLVGSMRPATGLSGDGAMNLYNAVAVATNDGARDKGVMIVMNDVVFTAREATKGHTTNPAAFHGRLSGILGQVISGSVIWSAEPVRTHTSHSRFKIDNVKKWPRVEVIYGHADHKPLFVDAAVNAGVDGIVFAGVGNGNPSPATLEALAQARKKGIAVVRSSRVGSGPVTLGAEVDDSRYGFVVADTLSPQKARILLQLALTQTKDPNELQEIFFHY